MFKKGDLWACLGVVALGVVILLAPAFKKSEVAVIYVNGGEYARYQLSGDLKTVDVNTEFGRNRVEISSQGARIIDASCKDKLDVKAGYIKRSGQSIVCLPNRFVLAIEGSEGTDAHSY